LLQKIKRYISVTFVWMGGYKLVNERHCVIYRYMNLCQESDKKNNEND